MLTIPNGVYPTMVTPFRDSDMRVDLPALEPLLRWYEERGVAGVFAICQSSEIFYLTLEERLRILREILRLRKPGTTVIASGHTAGGVGLQVREAKAVIAEGVDACVFISNRFAAAAEDEDTFLRRVEAVCRDLGDTPLGMYECPFPYKRIIPPETLRRLTGIGNFAFLKDTCCSTDMMRAKLAATAGTALKLFNANAATLLESLRLGAAGYSGVMANFHPHIYAKLCACWEEEPDLAEKLQAFVGFASLAEGYAYPTNAKYYLALEGVPMGWRCRCQDSVKMFPRNRQLEIEQMRDWTMLAG